MNCHIIVFLGLLGILLCCKASREHDKKVHRHTHVHRPTKHKRLSSLHKQRENDEPKLHKKEEMLGQDMMRINEAEFKLQSLVSPEFHQGSKALHRGRSYGNMEVNTLSPEQVDFVQATAQWPRFSNPESKKEASKTIYPEDPVLFPNEPQRQRNNYNDNNNNNNNNNNWITSMDSNSVKQVSGASFDDMPMGNMASMGNSMNPMVQEQPQQKANTMQFDVKPGYAATADVPIDDKMSFSDLGGIKMEAKNPLGFGGRSKNAMSALLNEGIMNPRGKPIGILGNILKASQEMPSGKPSIRSDMWTNDSPFSRRHKLERSQQRSFPHKPSSSLRNISKEHKKKSKHRN